MKQTHSQTLSHVEIWLSQTDQNFRCSFCGALYKVAKGQYYQRFVLRGGVIKKGCCDCMHGTTDLSTLMPVVKGGELP